MEKPNKKLFIQLTLERHHNFFKLSILTGVLCQYEVFIVFFITMSSIENRAKKLIIGENTLKAKTSFLASVNFCKYIFPYYLYKNI